MGAVLALEIEQEMYGKYVLSAPSSVKKEYNKKDYRQHYLMLMRNLKQRHNDPLVRTLYGHVMWVIPEVPVFPFNCA